GIGVEETLRGITQLVLAHLIKKYNLEGSEPIDRDLQILNAPPERTAKNDSLWEDAGEEKPAAAAAPAKPAAKPPAAPFVVDDSDDENIPLVHTELIGSGPAPAPPAPAAKPYSSHGSPFEDVTDFYSTPGLPADLPPLPSSETEVPMMSIEIPLPPGILDSLPVLDTQPQSATATISAPAAERRANDGLVKEVSIPLNLSLDEIRQHRRLRLKIT